MATSPSLLGLRSSNSHASDSGFLVFFHLFFFLQAQGEASSIYLVNPHGDDIHIRLRITIDVCAYSTLELNYTLEAWTNLPRPRRCIYSEDTRGHSLRLFFWPSPELSPTRCIHTHVLFLYIFCWICFLLFLTSSRRYPQAKINTAVMAIFDEDQPFHLLLYFWICHEPRLWGIWSCCVTTKFTDRFLGKRILDVTDFFFLFFLRQQLFEITLSIFVVFFLLSS